MSKSVLELLESARGSLNKLDSKEMTEEEKESFKSAWYAIVNAEDKYARERGLWKSVRRLEAAMEKMVDFVRWEKPEDLEAVRDILGLEKE